MFLLRNGSSVVGVNVDEIVESWEFLPGGETIFAERFGDDAAAQIADRHEKAVTGIPETLAAIKRAAEA